MFVDNKTQETKPPVEAATPATPKWSQPTLSITGPQHDVPDTVDPLLAAILQWPRPHQSFAEGRFRAWLAAQINARLVGTQVQYLAMGVMYCTVPDANNKASTTLFCCHIDTVDGQVEGALDVETQGHKRKSVVYDNNFGTIFLDKQSKVGTCLGADDGIGVWMMLNMLEQKVPGGYMFHTGEELHGIGSHAVLKGNLNILMKYEVALAFDRPRCNEVITHQGGHKCASDKFATALCTALNKHGFDYMPSTHGVFTDTKVYRGVIAECLNIGVGYENQHGMGETQDYGHACALLKAVCAIDWSALPVDRDPMEKDPTPHYYGRGYGSMRDTWDHGHWSHWSQGADDWLELDERKQTHAPTKPTLVPPAKPKGKKKGSGVPIPYEPIASAYDTMVGTSLSDMVFFAETEPELAADTIMEMLVEIGQLRSETMLYRKMIKNVQH